MWVPLLLLFWTVNTLAIGNFLQVQQKQIRVGRSCLTVLVQILTISGMWSVFPIYTNKSNFWALEQALNSTVATSIEYSVHLPVFQLPQGTHFAYQIF